ncbi:hypothetical protein [Streptomyces sp. MBT62]|uniref:phosphotransferase-like protein n=1 Tax=Streptomyces sp. MBT62 TaxID=2800410 RepID=UPI00190CAA63|nr:hypothetical protein [Streptomyces sp. MBT62]
MGLCPGQQHGHRGREMARGDRATEWAVSPVKGVHRVLYDIEVDTTQPSPRSAQVIAATPVAGRRTRPGERGRQRSRTCPSVYPGSEETARHRPRVPVRGLAGTQESSGSALPPRGQLL